MKEGGSTGILKDLFCSHENYNYKVLVVQKSIDRIQFGNLKKIIFFNAFRYLFSYFLLVILTLLLKTL